MPTPRTTLRRMSGGVQRRFRNARPGSVLILVVALLVLMALIGTAWLSTTQVDRYDVVQHQSNTEVELLVDGVVNMTRAAQVDDLADGGNVRPAVGRYGNYDSGTDAFMGSRVPVALIDIAPYWVIAERSSPVTSPLFRPRAPTDAPPGPYVEDPDHPRKYFEGQIVRYNPGTPPGAVPVDLQTHYYVCTRTHLAVPTGADDPTALDPLISTTPDNSVGYWLEIGYEQTPPPTSGGLPPAGQYVHSLTPVWPVISKLASSHKFVDLTGGVQQFPDRTFAIPTFMSFAGDDKFPALLMYSSNANPAAAVGRRGGMVCVPAADTDGDGVADAALFRVDVGTLNGLDYYAAVRVIDNGSAINVNTAYADFEQSLPGPGYVPASGGWLGMYKSSVDLLSFLNPDFGGPFPAGIPNSPRWREFAALNALRFGVAPTNVPLPSNTSAANGAITFATLGEAMEIDQSRRIGNPVGAYSPFSVGIGQSIAYHGGVLRDPDAALSPFEKVMSEANPALVTPPPNDPTDANYDPVWDRVPNRGNQKWKSYKEAPLSFGPRKDVDGSDAHPYDDLDPSSWPSFIYRWFDENYNQWGYTDHQFTIAANRYAANNPAIPTNDRLLMGRDAAEVGPVSPVRRAIRPLLVTRNPVSNQAPLKVETAGTPGVPPLPLDVPNPNPALPPIGIGMMPFGNVQPRASVNTALFPELWRAYFSVMVDEWKSPLPAVPGTQVNHTPFSELYRFIRDNAGVPGVLPGLTPGWHNNPYVGMGWVTDDGTALANHKLQDLANPGNPRLGYALGSVPAVNQPYQHPLRMFRSVLRPPHNAAPTGPPGPPWLATTPRMQGDQMLMLRSAIAAANTIQLRSNSNTVTPIDIVIPATSEQTTGNVVAGDLTPPLNVRIYGASKQPYITEIYVNTSAQVRTTDYVTGLTNENGYIAIELHNPYDFPIDIRHCKIATISRQSADRIVVPPPTPYAPHPYLHDYASPDKLTVIDRTVGNAPLPPAEYIGLPNDQRIILDPDYEVDGNLRPVWIRSNVEPEAAGSPPTLFHSPTVIPAHGYLVLENYDAVNSINPAEADPRAATYRPPALQVPVRNDAAALDSQGFVSNNDVDAPMRNFAFVRNLDRIINQEFVILRPLQTAINDPGLGTPYSVQIQGDPVTTTTPVNPLIVYGVTPTQPSGLEDPGANNNIPRFLAADMVPMDSYDFTGLPVPDITVTQAYAWHYCRASASLIRPANGKAWRCVYPGRYDGNKSNTPVGTPQRPRQQGTDEVQGAGGVGWDATAIADPWDQVDPAIMPPGVAPVPGFSLGSEVSGINSNASYPTEFTIQIANTNWPGIATAYPNGGFARNGDILQVPFIGSYRIKMAAQAPFRNEVMELNALPMDASFAEDTDPVDDAPDNDAPVASQDQAGVRREQIGRFCPLPAWDLSIAARGTLDTVVAAPMPYGPTRTVYDTERKEANNYWCETGPNGTLYDLVITSGADKGRKRTVIVSEQASNNLYCNQPWGTGAPAAGSTYELRRGNYRWATKLFDYLTVHSPHEDGVPNLKVTGGPNPPWVSNYGGAAGTNAMDAEIMTPVEGLVNINTAPWRVLAALPWPVYQNATTPAPNSRDVFLYNYDTNVMFANTAPGPNFLVGNGVQDNYDIAKAIVAYRDAEIAAGADPEHVFETTFDLMRVPAVQYVADMLDLGSNTDVNDDSGDLSPAGAAVDGVVNDFEQQFLTFNRLSNLITTRSDSFTNYVLVQGWRGVGTTSPELVVQRRRAFMSDRSGVNANSRDVPIQYFFND